jgi:hypothetical protein
MDLRKKKLVISFAIFGSVSHSHSHAIGYRHRHFVSFQEKIILRHLEYFIQKVESLIFTVCLEGSHPKINGDERK